eukprot:6201817-Pleurochrysis_carterae.AAC.2
MARMRRSRSRQARERADRWRGLVRSSDFDNQLKAHTALYDKQTCPRKLERTAHASILAFLCSAHSALIASCLHTFAAKNCRTKEIVNLDVDCPRQDHMRKWFPVEDLYSVRELLHHAAAFRPPRRLFQVECRAHGGHVNEYRLADRERVREEREP